MMIFILSLALNVSWGAVLGEPLKEYGIKSLLTGFQVTKNQKLGGARTQHIIESANAAGARLDIRIVGPLESDAAQGLIAQERAVLTQLYAAPATPYMGDINQAIGGCPSSFGPKQKEIVFLNFKTEVLLGAVKEDLAFGACSRAQSKFKGAYFAYYDAGSKLMWSWRAFAPWGKTDLGVNAKWLEPILNEFKK